MPSRRSTRKADVSSSSSSGSDSEPVTKKKPTNRANSKATAKKNKDKDNAMNDGEEATVAVKRTITKKIYLKTGQRKETPHELDGARLFYESLLNEDEDSEMAAMWCIHHGIFDGEKLEALIDRWGSGLKAKMGAAKGSTAKGRSRASKKIDDDNSGDDSEEGKPKTKRTPSKSLQLGRELFKRQKTKAESSTETDDSDDESEPEYKPKPSSRRSRANDD